MRPVDFDDDDDAFVSPGRRRPRLRRPAKTYRLREAEVLAPRRARLTLSQALDASDEERAYLEEQLGPFFEGALISAVLRRVKGGKEANVYCCQAHGGDGRGLIAAKVYRPRQFRNLRNDAQYRQGRATLTVSGQAVKATDWRFLKMLGAKRGKGLTAQQASWTAYEAATMRRLRAAGADVPEVFANSEHAVLMTYYGDVGLAAPTLNLVTLARDEAARLAERALHNVGLLLRAGVIHGDLSAYNILYWRGAITLIDFPQIVDRDRNPDARAIFARDVARVCQYFNRYQLGLQTDRITRQLWRASGADALAVA
jgi:RIO kinase 1